ncbi:MAG TPA: hypothetical protein P5526_06350 [Anaerolineae bacterium]|nr:hypothetical protein [Anaerolineae bacterium]MCB0223963.1 hypothetical protein [Anaerolineae bacterium]MCB9105660.1 hypothetical protein [Anaerolineales bacterium]HRV91765.1 hypothetical protein [Anaerolineae bacterium]
MFKSFLMRLARKLLESALGQLTKQFNVIDDQVLNPLNKIVDIVSGGAWIGEGANAFMDEINTLVIPKVTSIGTEIDVTKTLVIKAEDLIVQADERVSQLVNSQLVDAFKFY